MNNPASELKKSNLVSLVHIRWHYSAQQQQLPLIISHQSGQPDFTDQRRLWNEDDKWWKHWGTTEVAILVADNSQGAVVDCLTDAEQSVARLEHIKEGVCLCGSAELPALRISLTQTHQHTLVLWGRNTVSCKYKFLIQMDDLRVRFREGRKKYFSVIFICLYPWR